MRHAASSGDVFGFHQLGSSASLALTHVHVMTGIRFVGWVVAEALQSNSQGGGFLTTVRITTELW